jgi:hypothetical protein
MYLFRSPACRYWIVAFAVSLYQAIRGGIMQHQFANKQAEQPGGTIGAAGPSQLFFVRTLADTITYFVASLSGFGCLLIAYRLLADISAPDNITGGVATALIFLVIFGVLGITGDVYLDLVKRTL